LVKGISYGPWRLINKVLMKILAAVLVAVVFSCVSCNCLADQAGSTLQSAERWSDIAKIRLQTARDHERQADNAFRVNPVNSFETGDLLDFSGDERFLAPWLGNMAALSFSRGFDKSTAQAQEMKRGRCECRPDLSIPITLMRRLLSPITKTPPSAVPLVTFLTICPAPVIIRIVT
jgi:hypothetical protein